MSRSFSNSPIRRLARWYVALLTAVAALVPTPTPPPAYADGPATPVTLPSLNQPADVVPQTIPTLSLDGHHTLDVVGTPDLLRQVISPPKPLEAYLILVGERLEAPGSDTHRGYVKVVRKSDPTGAPVAELVLEAPMTFVFGAAFEPTFRVLYVTGGVFQGGTVRGRVVAVYLQIAPTPALFQWLVTDRVPGGLNHAIIHSAVVRDFRLFVAGSTYMPRSHPDGLSYLAVDGFVQVYTLDLKLLAQQELFTDDQRYFCQEELENNSLVVDATHLYVVADGGKWHEPGQPPEGCHRQPAGSVWPSGGEFGLIARVPYSVGGTQVALGSMQALRLPQGVSSESVAKVGDALYVAGFIRLQDAGGNLLGNVRHVITFNTAGGGFYPASVAYAPRISPTGFGWIGLSYGGIAAQFSPSGGMDIAVAGFTDDAVAFPHSRNFDAGLWYKDEANPNPLAAPIPAGFLWDDPPPAYAAMAFGTAFDATQPNIFYTVGCRNGTGAGYGNGGGECFNLRSASPDTASFLNVYRIVR